MILGKLKARLALGDGVGRLWASSESDRQLMAIEVEGKELVVWMSTDEDSGHALWQPKARG